MTDESEVQQAARELSKKGASKGGRARANTLTPEHRREIAQKAVRARWQKAGKQISDTSDITHPIVPTKDSVTGLPYSLLKGLIKFHDTEFECHVLSDLRRVFTQREVVRIISGGRESGTLGRYLSRNPLIDNKLESGPVIEFSVPGSSATANGYEATLLIEICDKYIEARNRGLLKRSQYGLAKQAEIVMRACAKVGIIALVDEATGFQKLRDKHALQLKFQAFIADDLQEWARMFPDEFWLELARLEGIHYSPRNRPLRWGRYIMMFVYDAIDADIGKELRKKNPNPHFLRNHHQWLKEFGRQKVNDQIQRVITIMRLCDNMDDFRMKFQKVFDKRPLQLDFRFD